MAARWSCRPAAAPPTATTERPAREPAPICPGSERTRASTLLHVPTHKARQDLRPRHQGRGVGQGPLEGRRGACLRGGRGSSRRKTVGLAVLLKASSSFTAWRRSWGLLVLDVCLLLEGGGRVSEGKRGHRGRGKRPHLAREAVPRSGARLCNALEMTGAAPASIHLSGRDEAAERTVRGGASQREGHCTQKSEPKLPTRRHIAVHAGPRPALPPVVLAMQPKDSRRSGGSEEE